MANENRFITTWQYSYPYMFLLFFHSGPIHDSTQTFKLKYRNCLSMGLLFIFLTPVASVFSVSFIWVLYTFLMALFGLGLYFVKSICLAWTTSYTFAYLGTLTFLLSFLCFVIPCLHDFPGMFRKPFSSFQFSHLNFTVFLDFFFSLSQNKIGYHYFSDLVFSSTKSVLTQLLKPTVWPGPKSSSLKTRYKWKHSL